MNLNCYNTAYWIHRPPTEARIRQAAMWERLKFILGFLIAPIPTVCAYIGKPLFSMPEALAYAISFVASTWTCAWWLMSLSDAYYKPLRAGNYDYALHAFNATPEGRSYLRKIREMHRELTNLDLEFVDTWRKWKQGEQHDAKNLAARRALYGESKE